MEELTLSELNAALLTVCDRIIENEPMLTELDLLIGDGDHGTGMKQGFTKLRDLLVQTQFTTICEMLKASGIELIKSMGGASGVLFGSLFLSGHELIQNRETLDADTLIAFFHTAAMSISARGKAKPGDKTMLDALDSAVTAMQNAARQSKDMIVVLKAASIGAQEGMEATKGMLPRLGRAKNFRDDALGHPDPGAVSVSIIFEALYEGVQNFIEKKGNDKQYGAM